VAPISHGKILKGALLFLKIKKTYPQSYRGVLDRGL